MNVGIASLAQGLPFAGNEFRVLPPGVFKSSDGRPANLPGWKVDAQIGARLAALAAAGDDLVIDYEHQTILTKTNGQPAPAAGWFNRLEWRDGQGVFAANVRWTDKAKAMIAAREYRYISPVFEFDINTGDVRRILGLGLTNSPALSGLTDLGGLAINGRQTPSGANRPKDSQHSIDTFNAMYGHLGIFHPDTPPEEIAALTRPEEKPTLHVGISENDAAKIRHSFPGVFETPTPEKPTMHAGTSARDAAILRHAFPGVFE